ncbi:hypothetical protein KAS41_04855, partial [Candidatus Parcubacteria bacterium]|nr:hypothetical protein [Candidatus Parcubacteria bacterium]
KIGRLRYLEKYQIQEIEEKIKAEMNIKISQTQIRRLCYLFLFYLGKYHYSQSSKISENMSKKGGYILHIDSTCEGQKPHLLTCIDSLSGIILFSAKICSENEVELTDSFATVKKLFGVPICIVHDMGRGIIKSADIVFFGVQRVICHFHLLRDIGKDLYEKDYRKLQKILSQKKIISSIKSQLIVLEKKLGGSESAQKKLLNVDLNETKLKAEELLHIILYGALTSLKHFEQSGNGYGFPFDCAKYEFYLKIKETYKVLIELSENKYFAEILNKSRFSKVKNILKEIVTNRELKVIASHLKKKIFIFNELRRIMRIALATGKKGLNDSAIINTGEELQEIECNLKEILQSIQENKDNSFYIKEIDAMVKQLEKYWDKIFATPITIKNSDGETEVIIPQRTNNISEQFYRKLKQLFRRLHGKKSVANDILFLPEEIVLIQNLKNKLYLKDLLGSIDELEKEFSTLDINNVELPFEKKEIEFITPQKIIKKLKNFQPSKLACLSNSA